MAVGVRRHCTSGKRCCGRFCASTLPFATLESLQRIGMPPATRGGSNRGGLSRENSQGRRRSQPNLSYSGSLPFLCALFCIARAQKCLDSCSTLEAVKKDAKNWGRHVGMTEWLLVWLIANALFVVWRVLVVSQAEARDLSLRREGAGRPLSQHALRGRLGR